MSGLGLALRNPALLVLLGAHFTSDLFSGILPIYLPYIKERFSLTNAAAGLAILAFSGMSSLTQPFFGYVADRMMRRWFLPATILWSAVFIALIGFAPAFPVFLVCAGLAGVGSGAFHPLGAATVAKVTDEQHRNGTMSLYTVGGTLGWGLGPLVAVALLAGIGPTGSAVLLLPAVIVAALVFRHMAMVERMKQARARLTTARESAGSPPWFLVGRVVGVTMLRSWTFLSILQFIPIWYSELGYSPTLYGPLVTVMIFAGAFGTLLGGLFADRLGPRRVVIGTLAAAIPALLIFVGFPGPWALATGFALGMFADASISVTLVMAQRLVPGSIGIASGVILGLGFVTGGIGVPLTGRLADTIGIQPALMSLAVLPALAILLALTLPGDAMARRPVLAPATR